MPKNNYFNKILQNSRKKLIFLLSGKSFYLQKWGDAFRLDLGHGGEAHFVDVREKSVVDFAFQRGEARIREVRRHFGPFQHFFRRTILVLIRTSRRLPLKIEHFFP